MPHAAPIPPVPLAPVPVLGQCAPPLSEQSTLWEIFIVLARVGIHFLIRFLPHTATLARSYPKHWRAFLESNLSFMRVLLTVRFAPERITIAQFRKLWRARQLIESLFGRPLPIFHSQPSTESLGPRTSSSATTPSPAAPATPSPNPPSATPLGTPGSRLASTPTPSIPQPHTPSVPEVPLCSLSHSRSRSQAPSSASSRSHTRSLKRAPASLQSIIAMMESSTANPQASSPHSAFRTPHSIIPPFIPDAGTLHAALKADTLPPNCVGALLENPADTLIKALHQVHTLIHAFPQLFPQQSPSPSNSSDQSVGSVQSVRTVESDPQSEISNLKSEIPDSPSPHSAFPIPHSTAPP